MMKIIKNPLFSLLVLGSILFSAYTISAKIHPNDNPYSPIDVKITMRKTTFKVGEKVDGKIYVENGYSATLPAIFNIKLYHDDQFSTQSVTSMSKIPSGKLVFSFKKFGIPVFNSTPASVGTWKIQIGPMNAEPSEIQEITLHIVPAK